MLIHNLRLKFKKIENEKVILETENNLEIVLPAVLLENYRDHTQILYLSLDNQIISDAEHNRKEILNDLLGNSEEELSLP
ncbi:hypothetical protein KBC40_00560 [Patescibacteria group bacterium]|jgi:hypothetical protein|nr:hypothetical protein [Patescibacteria group bacterium]